MLKNKSTKKKVNKELLRRPDIYVAALSNKEELTQARSATTGEKFDTLDERIDCEVDRLNKKIDVTMLQQEDKGSHTIENTVDGVTTDMIVKGRTSQNLCKKSTKISVSSNTVAYSLDSLFDLRGKELTIITDKKDNAQYAIYYKPLGGSDTSIVNYQNNNVIKFTVPNLNYGKLYMWIRGYENIYDDTYKFVILEGDYSNKSIPQYFEGIKSFGEAEGNKISILSHGKNLLKPPLEEMSLPLSDNSPKVTITTDGKYILDGGSTITGGRHSFKKLLPPLLLKKGVKYKISGNDSSNTILFINRFSDDSPLFNNKVEAYTPNEDTKVYFGINFSVTTYNNQVIKPQLEEGIIATSYEPYREDKKDILIKEPLRENDILYEDNEQVKVYRDGGKYVFTGNENMYIEETIAANNIKFVITTEGTDIKPAGKVICNKFIQGNDTIANSVRLGTSNKVVINIQSSTLESPNMGGFRKWLKDNPTEIIYQLATPTVEVVENCVDIDLKTFGERTYVSFENTISGTSSFKAPVNAATTISRLNRENRALEEENRSLRQDFESTTLSLTDSDLELVKQNVDIDFRLMEVEFALDIQQATLSSNINFKKKGEVKSMARTPYAMMKIVILSGDYDREDYIHKVGKYYERGRMTKEEHDELMSLMTADEVISKYKNSIK